MAAKVNRGEHRPGFAMTLVNRRDRILPMLLAVCALFPAAGLSQPLSDQQLFRDAVTAGKAANKSDQWYIFSEIAIAQAEHGYYTDAFETERLDNNSFDQRFVELVGIRAGNGDVLGAKSWLAAAPNRKTKDQATESIAVAHPDKGDDAGARETSGSLSDRSRVLQAISEHQVEARDLGGAIGTAKEMKGTWKDDLLFDIAQKLMERGEKDRAQEVARIISNRTMARGALQPSKASPTKVSRTPSDTCDAVSLRIEDSGKYAGAVAEIERANCECRSAGWACLEAGDPIRAKNSMAGCSSQADSISGLADLAKAFAKLENFQAALDSIQLADSQSRFYEGYIAPALRDIGREWRKRDRGVVVLNWARSRPDGYQRAMALLGVAESFQ